LTTPSFQDVRNKNACSALWFPWFEAVAGWTDRMNNDHKLAAASGFVVYCTAKNQKRAKENARRFPDGHSLCLC